MGAAALGTVNLVRLDPTELDGDHKVSAGKALLSAGVTARQWGWRALQETQEGVLPTYRVGQHRALPDLRSPSECSEGLWGYSQLIHEAINQRWPLAATARNKTRIQLRQARWKCSDTHTQLQNQTRPQMQQFRGQLGQKQEIRLNLDFAD